jgi:hypothetical protein
VVKERKKVRIEVEPTAVRLECGIARRRSSRKGTENGGRRRDRSREVDDGGRK